MSGDTFILTAEGAHKNASLSTPIGWSTNATSTTGTELDWHLPAGPNSWHEQFERLTFVLSVIGCSGTTPTTWSLQARFEYKVPHTIGYLRQFPVWAPFDAANVAGRVAEQCGWAGGSHTVPLDGSYGIVADQTDGLATAISVPLPTTAAMAPTATRITVSRTVLHQGSGVRVKVLPAISGGDSTTRILGSVSVTGWSQR